MTNGFGPWGTAFEGGTSAGLSAFWTGRLRRLGGIGAKSNRWSPGYLLLVATTALGLPTIRAAGENGENVSSRGRSRPEQRESTPPKARPAPVPAPTQSKAEPALFMIEFRVLNRQPNGKETLLAAPKLCLVEKHWSEFLVGGEVPLKLADNDDAIEMLEFGTRLRARLGRCTEVDRVRLHIQFVRQERQPAPDGTILLRGRSVESIRTAKIAEEWTMQLDDNPAGGASLELRVTVRRMTPSIEGARESVLPNPPRRE